MLVQQRTDRIIQEFHETCRQLAEATCELHRLIAQRRQIEALYGSSVARVHSSAAWMEANAEGRPPKVVT